MDIKKNKNTKLDAHNKKNRVKVTLVKKIQRSMIKKILFIMRTKKRKRCRDRMKVRIRVMMKIKTTIWKIWIRMRIRMKMRIIRRIKMNAISKLPPNRNTKISKRIWINHHKHKLSRNNTLYALMMQK